MPSPAKQPNFMRYPRPILELFDAALSTLKEDSRECIQNLLEYRAPRTLARFPRGQSAAVLVPLFIGRSGDVYVLLSRRSSALREYAGDTALPGGKVDAKDLTVEDTARREAFEEIGLPQDSERVPLLCVMEPFLAGNQTVVTPVVVLILDTTLQPNLNESEVTSIFAQPLASFLTADRPSSDPSRPYHSYTDQAWSQGGSVRIHSFLTGREADGIKPVFGLTANILIRTATIGYGRIPSFEVQPPNAPTAAQQIAYALLTPNNPLRVACDREGVNAEKSAARILRPSAALNAPRTIEWEKIGVDWKRLMEGSGSAPGTRPTKPVPSTDSGKFKGGFGGSVPSAVQRRVDDIAKHVVDRVENGGSEGMEGLSARIEEYKKRADMKKLGEYLDKTRDMVKKRREELKGDEEKLTKARKAYPKVMEGLKQQFAGVRGEDGEIDLKKLVAMIPKEGVEGVQNGLDAGNEGIDEGNEGKEEGMRKGREGTRKGLEEMKKHIKGGDGHNPEQLTRKKREAKL
ncbi:hypothetical protein J3A83DRAFT_4227892 [Scleroderma citrinum]